MKINVLDYLEETEAKYPDKAAFVDEVETYTYRDLKTYGQAIGSVIAEENIMRRPIVIYLDKSVRTIASFMGILYSGNFYCPIDITMPIDRVKVILEVAVPPIIITDKEHMGVISEIAPQSKVLLYEDIIKAAKQIEKLRNIRESMIDMDPIYVLFTSGSTGVPKGVVITHQSVIDYTEWVTDTFHITDKDSFGNQAPFYFDNSILDIYCGLKNGATVYIIPQTCFAFPARLVEYLNENKITTIFFVLFSLCNAAKLKTWEKVQLTSLNKVLFCGEVMPNKYLNIWRRVLPTALYANLYGPTEITDVCTYYIVDREFEDDEPLPIGRACRNTAVVILNENMQEAQKGEIGELCIRGRSLALGYYKNAEKSDAAFIQNPVNKEYRDLIYCTGDLVKLNERDEIIYLGRKDYQIKHMGHRIELGEIEAATGNIQEIETSACIYDDEKQRIVLFYVGKYMDPKEIKAILHTKIPEYMIPKKVINLEEFPYNANGKIDRKKLKEDYLKANGNE
ncbi:MAG: D-alanine--poly(phosphoribitol) ligase [Lachnospiraceae bacterium]|nr:D-alanine--poly(phosphoribitol) ligase [Lachnospiraceae bacterium]